MDMTLNHVPIPEKFSKIAAVPRLYHIFQTKKKVKIP